MSGIIVGPQTLPVEEGAKVLMAVAMPSTPPSPAHLCRGIVDPQMCGIGGYAEVDLATGGARDEPHPHGRSSHCRFAGNAEMWVNKDRCQSRWLGLFLEGKVNDAGYTRSARPVGSKGCLRSSTVEHDFVGAGDCTAARIAEEGFKVSEALSRLFRRKSPYPQAVTMRRIYRAHPEASRIYFKNGELPDMGETFATPTLRPRCAIWQKRVPMISITAN